MVSLSNRGIAAAAIVSGSLSIPATAYSVEPVDVALVLAVDMSQSVDTEEQRIQRAGYADAIASALVMRAIQGGDYRRIALTYFEWGGAFEQRVIVPWTVIDDPSDADAIAGQIRGGPQSSLSRTAIGSALSFAGSLIRFAPPATRRVIDVSGDGVTNDGPPPDAIRDALVAEGITINGLPIQPAPDDHESAARVEAHYRDCVIGGPGSFVVAAKGFGDFATALKMKLILEIAGTVPTVLPVQYSAPSCAE